MLRRFLVVSFVLSAQTVSAQPRNNNLFILPGVLETISVPKDGPCAKIGLSKDQREKLKGLYFKTKESILDLEAKLSKTGLESEKLFNDSKTSLVAVQEVSKSVVALHGKLLEVMVDYDDQIFFSILKPEQRGVAKMCEKMATMNEMFESHHLGMMPNDKENGPRHGPPPGEKEKESH